MNLTDKEMHTCNVISKVVNKEITVKEAAIELKKSRQHIYRLIKLYNSEGEQGFIHKNRGLRPYNKKIDLIVDELKELYLTEFYDFNLTHFYEYITTKEKYKGKYDISYSTLYNAFLCDNIISPISHKETIKLYNEKMKKAIKENQIINNEKKELFYSRQISFEKSHTRKSSNMFCFGQEIQMDACEKIWFGNIVTYLHLAVDKATKKVLFGWFEYEEITRGYFILLYNIIINYGIPNRIKTDNRTTFSNQENKVNTTQFGTICEELGIELITTSIPTQKANIERENGTFKNRLISEFRYEGINDIDKANQYLNAVFIPEMNKKFSYQINYKTSKMKFNKYSEQELNLIISERYIRIIDNASSIKYNNKYYVPINYNTGEIVCFMKKTECKVIVTYNAELWCKIENNYYILTEIEDRNTTMKREKENNNSNEKKKYIPPKDHPWRKFKI